MNNAQRVNSGNSGSSNTNNLKFWPSNKKSALKAETSVFNVAVWFILNLDVFVFTLCYSVTSVSDPLSFIHFLSVRLSLYMSITLSVCLHLSVHPSVFLLSSYPLSLSLPACRSVIHSQPCCLSLSLCPSVCPERSVRITWRQVGQHGRRWWGNKMFLSAQSRSNPLSSSPRAEPDYRKLDGGIKTDRLKERQVGSPGQSGNAESLFLAGFLTD